MWLWRTNLPYGGTAVRVTRAVCADSAVCVAIATCVVSWAASLHCDFTCHLRVDRTVVVVRTWFCEGKREMVIRMESLRFEYLVVIAGDDMGDIVVVRPCDRGSGANGDVFRVKTAVIDLDSGTTCALITRAGSCGQRKACHHYCRKSEHPLDSFHSCTDILFTIALSSCPVSCV